MVEVVGTAPTSAMIITKFVYRRSWQANTIKKWVPITYEAFMDYRVGGTEVSAKGKNIIQKLIKGEEVSPDDSGLSKREWNELMEAFELKDKLI